MTEPILLLYCGLILIASLVGGWLPDAMRLTHKRMEIAISGVAGFMLGIGLLHLLPHALSGGDPVYSVVRWLLLGFLVMFFLERFFCFHHHDPVDPGAAAPATAVRESGLQGDCAHHHEHRLTWVGVAVGLTLHSLIAGAALAASIEVQSPVAEVRFWPGLAVFLVIVLHKPFDSMTLGTLMAAGKRSRGWRYLVNGLFALAVPIGAALYHTADSVLASQAHDLTGPALAFSAGTFLCISLSDLLPELQFHQHDRYKLSAALLIGLGIAWSVSEIEQHTQHPHSQHNGDHATHGHGNDSPLTEQD